MVRAFRHKVNNKEYWYVRVRTGGKDRWRSLGPYPQVTKKMADALAEEISREIRLGRFNFLEVKVPVFSEFAKEFLSYQKDVVRKKSWERDVSLLANLSKVFASFRLTSITSTDILDYQERRLRDGRRPATVNRELACLKHLINVAKQKGKYAGDNPVSRVKFLEERNDVTRVLSKEEEDKLLAACPPYLYSIVVCALNTGMRKSETIGLKWKDVHLDTNVIVLESTSTKGKRLRKIPINKKLRSLLLEQKFQSGHQDYVFLNSIEKPYKSRHSMDIFAKICKELGLDGVNFHTLRHTFATRFMERGGAFTAAYAILGHRDPKVTMRYSHPDESMKLGVERLCEDEVVKTGEETNLSIPDHHKPL